MCEKSKKLFHELQEKEIPNRRLVWSNLKNIDSLHVRRGIALLTVLTQMLTRFYRQIHGEMKALNVAF